MPTGGDAGRRRSSHLGKRRFWCPEPHRPRSGWRRACALRERRRAAGGGSAVSKDTILNTIRRNLRRGPLPADQAAMLDGRLATHPRHLIPARSRLPRPEQVALFVRNLEKEFATVERVPEPAAVPAAVADYLAAQNLPSRFAMAPHEELAAIPWEDRPLLEAERRRADPARGAARDTGCPRGSPSSASPPRPPTAR